MYNYFQLNSALNEFQKQACNDAVVLTNEKCDILECLERLRPTYLEPIILLSNPELHQVYSFKKKKFSIKGLIEKNKLIESIKYIRIKNIIHSIRVLVDEIPFLLAKVHPDQFTYEKYKSWEEPNGIIAFSIHQKQNQYMRQLVSEYKNWMHSIIQTDESFNRKIDISSGIYYVKKSKDGMLPNFLQTHILDIKQGIQYDDEVILYLVKRCYRIVNLTISYVINKHKTKV